VGAEAGLVFFVVVVAVAFYWILLRPVMVQQWRQRSDIQNLEVGDELLTADSSLGWRTSACRRRARRRSCWSWARAWRCGPTRPQSSRGWRQSQTLHRQKAPRR